MPSFIQIRQISLNFINLEFAYWLRGATGDEEITIVDGNFVTSIALNKTETLFETTQTKILILFTNDNGPRDVFFRSNVPTLVESSRFSDWNCGSSTEKSECDHVRRGEFFQDDRYTIAFNGKFGCLIIRVMIFV